MRVVKAPSKYRADGDSIVFLAGSIENGQADNWQARAEALFSDYVETLILNPRREEWDRNTPQTSDNLKLVKQIKWELQGLEDADIVLMYFDPNTISPISLLELGHLGGSESGPEKLFVVCPDGFHRKANVEVYCDRYEIRICDTLEEAVKEIVNEWGLETDEEREQNS